MGSSGNPERHGNENVTKQTDKQKTIGSISKTTALHVKHTVWYIILRSLQNFDNFMFYSSLFTDPLFSLSRSSSARRDKNRLGQVTFIIEDMSTLATIFFFFFWTWIRPLKIQLLINSHNITFLTHNTFTFNRPHYQQINGTAMGTKMAPSYANLFMGKFEEPALAGATHFPLN